MIATLAATEKRTFKSWGNFNNLIGFPLCIDNTPDDFLKGRDAQIEKAVEVLKGELAKKVAEKG